MIHHLILELCCCSSKSGGQPRAVGKRTPRFPVSYLHKKDNGGNYVSPIKRIRKSDNDNEDEVAHVAALALTEAAQRVGSPQVSTPYKRQENVSSSPAQSWERLAMVCNKFIIFCHYLCN